MKLLGIDFGTKKIGLAIAENDLVEPLGIISAQGGSASGGKFSNWESQIGQICQIEGVEKIVVGISEGKSGQRAKVFAKKLARATDLPVELTDETLTTRQALAKMKTVGKKWKDKPDAIAAALILQQYLGTSYV